ncbi:tRNA (adenosine(37)-N6)-threonylcarbamoyltransferase complex dimerization subunit type 1 TsaB [Reinekea sp.]|jgi:tRNA threonylcarbamoyladenosine biosynthesis protein TsaB|uniref:tRNA (adenosine(37)-N6)-threonylcarbamoyltransferase complex dimerization subunit type 1 TsaB n=1 Tax=Reinekea sp. TaxID=1970455 RepID=UPI002A7FB32C|nr:tRNA (adenosine(37)-N6)-threonylcarbamoyltransferase complex dimerization subunit type 1 TsaB [Reinekea sp.]
MNILSIDTTADICSIALVLESKHFVFHEHRPREHAKILLPEIEKLLLLAELRADQLDLIVFGRGPGSFTGVRIATGVAQGLGLAAQCQLAPISTLQSLAWSAAQLGHTDIWVALDARMSEVYFAAYRVDSVGIPELTSAERVTPLVNIETVPEPSTVFIGSGWTTDYATPALLSQRLQQGVLAQQLPNALASAHLAMALVARKLLVTVAPELAQPVYLRNQVAWTQKPKVGT